MLLSVLTVVLLTFGGFLLGKGGEDLISAGRWMICGGCVSLGAFGLYSDTASAR